MAGFLAGQGNADAKAAVATAIAGGTARFQGAANTAIGTPRYCDVQVSPILGADGKPSHLLSISRDITTEHEATAALKDAAERQLLLTQELEHRFKNTLATVSAIANQTMQGEAYAAVRQAFTDRLITLARAHDLLTRTSWSGAPIREVVEGGLAPHRTGRNRIEFSGPDLELHPRQALGLSLAIHELATNAIKYGALVSASGSIDVSWSKGDHPGFRFTSRESGGPEVREPPAEKKGFSTRLIERMLENDFAGQVKTTYAPTGIICELVAPE